MSIIKALFSLMLLVGVGVVFYMRFSADRITHALYDTAFTTFFQQHDVTDRLSSRWLAQPVLYIDPSLNDGTGSLHPEIRTLLTSYLTQAQIHVTTIESESAGTISVSSTTQAPAMPQPPDGFAGPTIIILLTIPDKEVQTIAQGFGLGYMLIGENTTWQAQQYLLITS